MSIPIKLDVYKGNHHPAKIAAKTIYGKIQKGKPGIVVKATGAGATTGICATAIDNGEVFLLVEPLKSGAREVLETCVPYADKVVDVKDDIEKQREVIRGLKTMSFPTNKDCIHIIEKIKKNPSLEEWDKYNVNCKECEDKEKCWVYESVQVTEKDQDRVGYGITYSGLRSSILSMYRDMQTKPDEPSIGAMRIEKILKRCDTIVVDECHLLEFGNAVTIPAYDAKNGASFQYHSRFCGIMGTPDGEYPELKKIVTNVDLLINDIRTQDAILRCCNESTKDDNSQRLLNIKISNPYYTDIDDPKNYGHFVAVNNELINLHTDIRRPIERLSSVKKSLTHCHN
ncbi:MAG: hypothetical protein A4E23_01690 [Methanomethylovorans sp. PtaU1.Bin073]|nr:MAG: hypothetical protein A4E23_01690 [Methanomethylovorans sp. PtaU1.Bin073]